MGYIALVATVAAFSRRQGTYGLNLLASRPEQSIHPEYRRSIQLSGSSIQNQTSRQHEALSNPRPGQPPEHIPNPTKPTKMKSLSLVLALTTTLAACSPLDVDSRASITTTTCTLPCAAGAVCITTPRKRCVVPNG